MRFASLGGNNANKYIAAGAAQAKSGADIFATTARYSNDYGMLAEKAMNNASSEKIAGMKAEARVTNAATNAVARQKQVALDAKVYETKSDIKASQRKAGGLAAIGKIAGAGFLAATDNTKGRERPKGDLQGLYDSWKTKHDGLKATHKSESDALGDYKPGTFEAPDSTVGGGSGKATGGSGSSSNLGGQTFDISKLTDNDYKELGYVISSEAQLGTDDEFGVAANVLTRLQSGSYGKSIGEIIRAKGQYEGVYSGNSSYSPKIEARLKSPEGQKKIQEFFTRLDGRTEFKGQTMLSNRVKDEDPMFSSGGNFYHYAGQ